MAGKYVKKKKGWTNKYQSTKVKKGETKVEKYEGEMPGVPRKGQIITKVDKKGLVTGYKKAYKTKKQQGVSSETRVKNPFRKRYKKYKGRKYKIEGSGTPLLKIRKSRYSTENRNPNKSDTWKDMHISVLGKEIYSKSKRDKKKKSRHKTYKKVAKRFKKLDK